VPKRVVVFIIVMNGIVVSLFVGACFDRKNMQGVDNVQYEAN
jgi:hypothetical protein